MDGHDSHGSAYIWPRCNRPLARSIWFKPTVRPRIGRLVCQPHGAKSHVTYNVGVLGNDKYVRPHLRHMRQFVLVPRGSGSVNSGYYVTSYPTGLFEISRDADLLTKLITWPESLSLRIAWQSGRTCECQV